MRLLVGAAFAALIAIGAPAFAADHWQDCASAHEAGAEITGNRLVLKSSVVRGGIKTICYDTDGAVDSPLLNLVSCQEVDVTIFNMTSGQDVVATEEEADWEECATDSASDNHCQLVGSTLTAGNLSHQGRGQSWGFVNNITNANTNDIRVMVRCNGG